MDNTSLTHGFFNSFKKDKLSFAYMGFLSNPLVISAINLIEQHLESDNSFKKIRHKLSFLMIESFQNILRYGDEPLNKDMVFRKEMFMVRNIGGNFYIGSVNIIENKKVEFVKARLNHVNDLAEDDLHQLYRKILTNNKFTDAGGAGLGFIEMARKTNQKLQYDFVNVDDQYSYFYLLICVKVESDSMENLQLMDIRWIMDFHALMAEQEIILIHKGNFSPEVIEPVIFIVENNINSEAVDVHKLTSNVMLEALQNVSLHSLVKNDEKEAIFMIGRIDGKQYISTGNYIKTTKVKHLRDQLEQLLSLSINELEKLYKENIKKKKATSSKAIGLGLIEIALESKKLFSFNFSKLDGKISFYTFDVLV
jgi:hypothetical protein